MRDVVAKVCLLSLLIAALFASSASALSARSPLVREPGGGPESGPEPAQEGTDTTATPPFKIIVNPNNPTPELQRVEISRIFLKETPSWPNGVEARPVDQAIGSPLRESFSRVIHQKGASAVRNYWQQEIYAGREVPPPERASDADVAQYVRENRGAIGYVSEAADPPGVRVLTIVD